MPRLRTRRTLWLILVIVAALSACNVPWKPKPIPRPFPSLPTSGSEIPFFPGLWNDYSAEVCPWFDPRYIQCMENCYAYALNFTTTPPYGHPLQPGELSGHTLTEADITIDRIPELVRADSRVGGFTFTEATRDVACTAGTYKVALVVDPFYPDYHWYRQNPDGTWSGKSGLSRATDKDASNQTITDPATANRNYRQWGLNYSDFGGYFCIGSPWR
jgi:hypothetical protein